VNNRKGVLNISPLHNLITFFLIIIDITFLVLTFLFTCVFTNVITEIQIFQAFIMLFLANIVFILKIQLEKILN